MISGDRITSESIRERSVAGMKITFWIAIGILGVSLICYAHSGRTDSSGGHHDRKNGGYHYHGGGSRRSSSGSSSIRRLGSSGLRNQKGTFSSGSAFSSSGKSSSTGSRTGEATESSRRNASVISDQTPQVFYLQWPETGTSYGPFTLRNGEKVKIGSRTFIVRFPKQ